ncbi:MAG: hypothetical protein NUW21_01900 [Elusimicrobia bacterium]|nr:hypothetical protein [Elusimicrobiota bacterium]
MHYDSARKKHPDENRSPKLLTFPGLDDERRSVTIHEGHYFMRTIRQSFKRCAFVLALSMSALPNLVNAQAQSLTSVNKANSSKPELKDSVKEPRTDIARLISAVLKKGTSVNTGSNLGPVIGLPKAMSAMDVAVDVSKQAGVKESRRCFVVFENIEVPAAGTEEKRPLCAYVVKTKRFGLEKHVQYFRLGLNGNLEKIVVMKGKYDESGKAVKGSGIVTNLDIASSEARKSFEAEMKFWLKDWLKKEQRNAAKKTADAATKKPSASAL